MFLMEVQVTCLTILIDNISCGIFLVYDLKKICFWKIFAPASISRLW